MQDLAQFAEISNTLLLKQQKSRGNSDEVGMKRKRGVKPAADYMNIAVDNLENLYIEYAQYPYKKDSSSAAKKERARRRNEISALESRITKKIGEM